MKKSVGNIEYNDDAALNYGGNIKDEINTDTDICMYVKESDDYNDDSKGIINAEIAASDIQPDVVKNDGKNNGGGALTEGERSKAKKDALVKEEKEYLSELTHLKQLYMVSDLMTQEEYARLAEDLEMRHLNRQLEVAGMEPEEIEKINQKIISLIALF